MLRAYLTLLGSILGGVLLLVGIVVATRRRR
jgi:hypothetical protein